MYHTKLAAYGAQRHRNGLQQMYVGCICSNKCWQLMNNETINSVEANHSNIKTLEH